MKELVNKKNVLFLLSKKKKNYPCTSEVVTSMIKHVQRYISLQATACKMTKLRDPMDGRPILSSKGLQFAAHHW